MQSLLSGHKPFIETKANQTYNLSNLSSQDFRMQPLAKLVATYPHAKIFSVNHCEIFKKAQFCLLHNLVLTKMT